METKDADDGRVGEELPQTKVYRRCTVALPDRCEKAVTRCNGVQ